MALMASQADLLPGTELLDYLFDQNDGILTNDFCMNGTSSKHGDENATLPEINFVS